MKITVFTPTYNRGEKIVRLYESLKRQTKNSFEWLIIDDGSTDNTDKIVSNWKKENKQFEINYYKQSNGGKHRAINKGIDLAKGELFFIVDSDDYLADNAIEKVIWMEATIKDKSTFAGIAGVRVLPNGDIIGKTFEREYVDCTSLERKKFKIVGDKSEVIYTSVLKENKFPEFEGEKFLTEGIVWNRLASKGLKIRWFNEKIYYGEYLKGGLTDSLNVNRIKNPKGYALSIKELIKKSEFMEKLANISMYSYLIYEYKEDKRVSKELEVSIFLVWLSKIIKKFRDRIKKRV